jgi:hypothetical protein
LGVETVAPYADGVWRHLGRCGVEDRAVPGGSVVGTATDSNFKRVGEHME